jgi:hypothetical protein
MADIPTSPTPVQPFSDVMSTGPSKGAVPDKPAVGSWNRCEALVQSRSKRDDVALFSLPRSAGDAERGSEAS